MQRAKAVQEQHQSPGSSSSLASIKPEEKQIAIEDSTASTDEPEGANDEHWTLPSTSRQVLKQSASTSSSLISHEPGWNAWLFEAEDGRLDGAEESGRVTTRRSFGSCVKKVKTKKKESSEEEKDAKSDEGGENYSSEEQEKPIKIPKGTGFVKPGSIKEKQEKRGKHHAKALASPSHERDQRSDKGKKRKSKGGARPLLSGFPNQSKEHKSKKFKS